jgi:hypothetical protein
LHALLAGSACPLNKESVGVHCALAPRSPFGAAVPRHVVTRVFTEKRNFRKSLFQELVVATRMAFPSVVLLTLTLAACGGGGNDPLTSVSPTAVDSESVTRPDLAATMEAEAASFAAVDAAELAADPTTTPSSESAVVAASNGEPSSDTIVAGATTSALYVAATGSDANPGTQAAPFKTILKASTVAQPGVTVYVAPGNYAGGFQTTTSGTEAARITYASTVKWGAKIVPPAASRTSVAWRNTGNYVTISGFEVDGTKIQSGTRWWTGLSAPGSYNVVENNRIHHIGNAAIDCTSAGGSGINTNNYYYGYNNKVVGNVIHDIGTSGCKFMHGIYFATSGEVKNNLVYRVGFAGIHLWHDAYDVDIVNNTVANSGFGIYVGAGEFYHSTTMKVDFVNVHNNIVVGNTKAMGEMGQFGTNITWVNNLVYKNTYTWLTRNRNTGTIAADPQFVNPAADDYRLKSTSPAIDKGAPTYAPAFDIVGTPRPTGVRHDVGAYEYTL